QISRIVDDGRHDEILTAWLLADVEVLGHRGILAVRHTVLPQIAGSHLRRHHRQRTASSGARSAAATGFPSREGLALPRGRGVWGGRRRRKAKEPGLRAGIGVKTHSAVVLPRDVNAPGHSHDGAGTVRLAL